jgi:hypothetical protein
VELDCESVLFEKLWFWGFWVRLGKVLLSLMLGGEGVILLDRVSCLFTIVLLFTCFLKVEFDLKFERCKFLWSEHPR